MFDFKLLSLAHLKRIASYYNKHIQIKGVSKMSKEDLIKNLEIHLFINELGEIKLKDHSDMVLPKNPKNKSEKLLDFNKNMLNELEDKLDKKKVIEEAIIEDEEIKEPKKEKSDFEEYKKIRLALLNAYKVGEERGIGLKEKRFERLYNKIDEKNLLETLQEVKKKGNKLNKEYKKEMKESKKKEKELEGGAKGFALHAVLVDKSIPFEEAFKQAQEIIKKKKFFYRESKNQYRFRNIPKQKFEPRSFKSKKVNENLTLVFGKLKPEHSHLEGAGIFDWIKSKASGAVSAVKNYFKPRLDGYNNISKKTIEQYGNMPIKQLFILRTPISGGLNKVINFVSLGKWDELKKKYAFDSLFHLSLVALLENGKNIIIEKNDVVNISPEYKMYPTSETVDIPIGNDLTINKILDTARTKVGDNTFFSYDAFNKGQATNCQGFLKILLENQGLYSEQAKNFLFQDLENIYNELPSYVPKIMKGATTLGAITNKILGKGKDKIIMNPDNFIKEHQKLITLLRQFDIPKLTVEANEQAKELKKETGVDLTGGKKKKIYH